MSLSGAISAAVTALNAQSSALALVSNNLANASTTAYKTTDASFASLLAGSSSSGVSSGGVAVTGVSNITEQGTLVSSSESTYVAIDGDGFFVVKDAETGGTTYYTRNGEFGIDDDGLLVNNGYYLQGWPTDADGNVTGTATDSSLESVDLTSIQTIAAATTSIGLKANLPAEATITSGTTTGDSFTSTFEVNDSLGTAASVTVTWTKTAENEWTATFSDPTSDGSTVGTISPASVTLNFNEDGTFASSSGTSMSITNWTTGAADSTVALDFGDADTATGLSQYTTGDETLTVSLETTNDGMEMGTLTSVEIDEEGNVIANYDNDQSRSIYKLPVATFTNANGLSANSYGMYSSSSDSGDATLRMSGQDGAGTIKGSQIEQSLTDTSTEFANMMSAQQAYSGAAQVMSAASSMFDTLISAVR